MSFPMDEMADIIDDFVAEAIEGLDTLDQRFVELEKNPGDSTLLNDIFRSVHTIKGAAGFLGFDQVVEVTHVTEDVLNKLRKGEMAMDPKVMDAVLDSADLIRVLITNIKEKKEKKEDVGPVLKALSAVLAGAEGTASKGAKTGPKKKKKAPGAKKAAKAEVGAAVKQEPAAKAVPPAAAVPSATGETARNAPPVPEQHAHIKEQSIRVDIDRLDSVMNLVGEMVLSRNRMMMLGSRFNESQADNDITSHLNEGIAQLDLVTSDLQVAVMKMRMQPIAKVFNKFPRMVRDMARQSKKEIELVIRGEETELDKTVIEEIGDPLVHLIRNSVDHGIERADEREAAGKSRCGTITLSACQEGRHIIVYVEDDGKGIDAGAVKSAAVEKGLIQAEEAERMSDKDAHKLIFAPGFSTAKVVSNISGRGVGMDVVKTNISKINGVIEIESTPGKGSKLIFRLPLTLAIIPVLTVEAGSELYGIPLSTVVENIRLSEGDIRPLNNREVIHLRDRVFPVLRLSALVSGDLSTAEVEGKYVVLIGIGEKMFGILVDKLHGQEDIVMKSMGEYLKGTEGIAGACITGDGSVVLILDLIGLLETGSRLCAS